MPVTYSPAKAISYFAPGQAAWAHHQKWVSALRLGGLCCSWAMDYVKKCLANKALNLNTYNDEGRVKKIAVRHALQQTGGIGAVAKSYGLDLGPPVWTLRTSHIANNTVTGSLQPGTYYYVELHGKKQGRLVAHGFAFYCQSPTQGDVADSYSGVKSAMGSNCAEIVEHHCTAVFGEDLTFASAYPLTLS